MPTPELMKLEQQYHFRNSEKGLLSWDAFCLMRLSANFTIKEIPLSDIKELQEELWYGLGAKATCESVARHAKQIFAADFSYPIILSIDGKIMDGMHRVFKALIEELDTVLAVQFSSEPAPDYIGVDRSRLKK